MSRNIERELLESLYNGEIYPLDRLDNSPELKRENSLILSLLNKLQGEFTTEDYEKLIAFSEEKNREEAIVAKENFITGFSLGVRMTAEALLLSEKDNIE